MKNKKNLIIVAVITIAVGAIGFSIFNNNKNSEVSNDISDGMKVAIAFEKEYYTQLKYSNVTYSDGKVHIVGKTDLPDNTIIDVTFDYPKDTKSLGISNKAKVKNGSFETDITPTDIPEFKGDKEYILTLEFNLSSQENEKVKKLVGEKGRRLSYGKDIENEENNVYGDEYIDEDKHKDEEGQEHKDEEGQEQKNKSDIIIISSVYLDIK